MGSHKSILKVTYATVGLAIIAVIALTIYQQRQIKKIIKAKSTEVSSSKQSENVPGNAAGHGGAEIKKDSATRDDSYDVLFKDLALSPEKQRALEAIFHDLKIRKTDMSVEMLDTSIPEEKRGEIRLNLEILKIDINKKIHDLIGRENFEKYVSYEERLRERTLLAAFFRSLSPNELPAKAREQAFIDAMFEKRKKIEAEHSFRNDETQSEADLESQVSRVMEVTDQTYSEYIKVAGMYLPPPQVEQFKNYLDQRRDTMTVSLNAMRQVFGNDSVSGQTDN